MPRPAPAPPFQPPAILRGTRVAAVDLAVLKRSCKKLKLAVDPSDRDAMVVTLADYFVKLHGGDHEKILHCEDCNGPSDESYDACPYCGAKDSDPPKGGPPADKPPQLNSGSTDDKNPSSTGSAAQLNLGSYASDEVHATELVSSKNLDDSVQAIRAVEQNLADGHWRLGQLLADNWERNLYTLRLNEAGKPLYKNWGQWVEAECGIGPRYALDLISVSRTFSEADIKQVGVTKLRPMCRIPDEAKRNNLLERSKQELVGGKPMPTKRVIEEAKRVIDEGGGKVKRQPGRHAGGRKPATRARLAAKEEARKQKQVAANEKAVAIVQQATVKLPMFKRDDKHARAKTVADFPVAVEQSKGVTTHYRLGEDKDGFLELLIERETEAVL